MELKNSRFGRIVTIVILLMVAIVGIIMQVLSTVEAHREKDERNTLFPGMLQVQESTVEKSSVHQIPADESINEDVDGQTYVESPEQSVAIYFEAPEAFYDDLFTAEGYGRILAEISTFLAEEEINVTGALIVDEDSIMTDREKVEVFAVSEEVPELGLWITYVKESKEFRFEIYQR